MSSIAPISVSRRSIVVDLDGALILTDLLHESALSLIAASPIKALGQLPSLFRGDVPLKERLAELAELDTRTIPLNTRLLGWLEEQRRQGAEIYLASKSAERYVAAIAKHLGIFDGVFIWGRSSDRPGRHDATELTSVFGERGFDYVGDGSVKTEVLRNADRIYLVGSRPDRASALKTSFPDAEVLPTEPATFHDYVRLLRVHQWLKNALVFVPALAGHNFSIEAFLACIAAFFGFSFCASGVYVLNDLLDLRSDRMHPTKKNRPLASGKISIAHGLLLVPLTMALAIAFSLLLPWEFFQVLCVYYALTLAYSLHLKRQTSLDVVVLAMLYGVRILAGSTATHDIISPWLLAFSLFLFSSLAFVKRCSELEARLRAGGSEPIGRGYVMSDLQVLSALAASSGLLSVLTVTLYINSISALNLYSKPQYLLFIPIILMYWICNILIITHRGQMNEDPVLYAAKDYRSWTCGGLIMFAAILST